MKLDEVTEGAPHSTSKGGKKGLKGAAYNSTKDVIKPILDKSHHPVLLPHGNCRIVWDEGTDQYAIEVPGVVDEKAKRAHVFTQCPAEHAVGYEQVRPRYVCGKCGYKTYNWPAAKQHTSTCDTGAKAEKLIGETN